MGTDRDRDSAMRDFTQRIARLSPEARAILERRLQERAPRVSEGLISRRVGDGPAVLSFGQERLWLLDRLDPGKAVYNISRALRIRGRLDVEALGRALETIEERHEVLRSVFPAVDGNPVQVVGAARTSSLPVMDLGAFAEADREAEALRIAEEEAGRPFDLAVGPMLRAMLLRLGEEEHVLLVNIHHIVFDGWSTAIFDDELARLYAAYLEGRPSPLAAVTIQYADFAVWQREWLRGEVLEEQLSYWKGQLEGAPAVLELPTSRARSPVQSFRGATEAFSISQSVADGIRGLGQREGATLFMTLLAAFKVLLLRYSGQEDVVVGSPVAGRHRSDIEGLIGFFVNTLVLRTDLSGDPTFRELLGRVREVAIEAYAHQDLPFERLVEELNPERSLSHSPLFQVLMVLQNATDAGPRLAGVSVTALPMDVSTSKFDLVAHFADRGREIAASFRYNTDLFDASMMQRMVRHLEVLLGAIAEDPDRPLSQLPLLTERERHQVLVEWNQTETEYPREKTVHGLFEEQAGRAPEAVAVEFEGKRLTYGQLNERANRLARYLSKRGVGPEVLVGLCVERSLEMVVGLLGILKAGGAYLPLDPAYPGERLRFMLEDAGARLVLTQKRLANSVPEGAQRVQLDADWTEIARESAENPQSQASAENLAYVIYTSGSTGKPKGVSICHRSVVRLVRGTDYARFGPDEVFLQFAPISFDASTFEIWGALLNGARLVVMPPGLRSAGELGAAVRRNRVTTLWLAAGLFREMLETESQSLRGLRQLLAGGDVLSLPHVEKVLRDLPDCRLINGYGPTESTTFACCYTVRRDEPLGTSVPIGRPIANTRVFILDRNRIPVPIGVPGELYIGGDGLARGYFGRPELTAARFVPSLFGKDGEERHYRTGDRARYRADGRIEFLGRIDDQTKIRGFRVEPGEIESALVQDPSVREAVIVVQGRGSGDRRLVAYLVKSSEGPKSVPELRAFLKRTLPDFMIPSTFVWLDSFPLTPNGKLDRAALPLARDGRPASERGSVAPRGTSEAKLVSIFERVLDLRPVGVTDNFFDLGGNSLLAVRLLAQIEKATGRSLPLSMIFQAQTVEEMAATLEDENAPLSRSSLVAIQSGGWRPPLYLVHCWNGSGFEYRGLAPYLGPDQPLYGIAPQGLDGRLTPHDRVEDMAAHYIQAIREIQPEGPYYLGGWSLGGTVAFEMARQLQAGGQKVAFLALVDTRCSSGDRPALRPPRGRARPSFIWQRLMFHVAAVRRLEPKRRFQYLVRRSRGGVLWVWQRLRALHVSTRDAVADAHRRAVQNYVPKQYEGSVTVFRASGSWSPDLFTDPYLGWGEICTGELDLVEVSGFHGQIFKDGASLRDLGEKLSDRLCIVQEGESVRVDAVRSASRSSKRLRPKP